jgi:hypothetical protein
VLGQRPSHVHARSLKDCVGLPCRISHKWNVQGYHKRIPHKVGWV